MALTLAEPVYAQLSPLRTGTWLGSFCPLESIRILS